MTPLNLSGDLNLHINLKKECWDQAHELVISTVWGNVATQNLYSFDVNSLRDRLHKPQK